jgi:hypothetical protein
MTVKKILQIIPADNWALIYKNSDGTGGTEELAVWALVLDENGDTVVVGMYNSSDGPFPWLEAAPEDSESFVRYQKLGL